MNNIAAIGTNVLPGIYHTLHTASRYLLTPKWAGAAMKIAVWLPAARTLMVNPSKLYKQWPEYYEGGYVFQEGRDPKELIKYIFRAPVLGYQLLSTLATIGSALGIIRHSHARTLGKLGSWASGASLVWAGYKFVTTQTYRKEKKRKLISNCLYQASRFFSNRPLIHIAGTAFGAYRLATGLRN